MPYIDPRPQQLQTVIAQAPKGVPVVMLNLLSFRDQANYADGTQCSGREAYARYGKAALGPLGKAGASVIWSGSARGTVIGPDEEQWDQVLLVRYPSVEAFLAMVTSAEYQAIVFHRSAALADSRLTLTLESST
ncbi:DUF1330 domain-containing protein [Aestuariirhabdus litorea]|uniref:DUF1330 domain-containing protein n=1 Tax=Aestuariirhabdus litorea TaxID=2528527 RepID=A0A3P3VMF7_9GAMM|nr:DUF1330 domain-containing protein [Aestuariirhabdus litorea]RRJ83951.1 DUF1330 domain-containing protein [Aestuariirhabdus litorea]RWW97171.1 DUF1330 domain-containing protein [Endozoicomonadaceae bacterium GTF-13]